MVLIHKGNMYTTTPSQGSGLIAEEGPEREWAKGSKPTRRHPDTGGQLHM